MGQCCRSQGPKQERTTNDFYTPAPHVTPWQYRQELTGRKRPTQVQLGFCMFQIQNGTREMHSSQLWGLRSPRLQDTLLCLVVGHNLPSVPQVAESMGKKELLVCSNLSPSSRLQANPASAPRLHDLTLTWPFPKTSPPNSIPCKIMALA